MRLKNFLFLIPLLFLIIIAGCKNNALSDKLSQPKKPRPNSEVIVSSKTSTSSVPAVETEKTQKTAEHKGNNHPSSNNPSLKELTDEELLTYAKSSYDKKEMMFKDIIIGRHKGIPVRVTFPCSDVCPDYTTRIIRYDVDIDKCEEIGGKVEEKIVPVAIAVMKQKFCVPEIISGVN